MRGVCLDTVLSLCSHHVITCVLKRRGSGLLMFRAFSGTMTSGPSMRPLFRDSEKFRCAGQAFRTGLRATKVARDVSQITRYVSGNPVRKF